MTAVVRTTGLMPPNLMRLDCVADHYRRYAGEPVTVSVRVILRVAIERLRVVVDMPEAFVIKQLLPPPLFPGLSAELERVGDQISVAWELPSPVPDGMYEFTLTGDTQPGALASDEREDEMRFVARANLKHAGASFWQRDGVSIAIVNHARYLRYLPSLYRNDETMGRFLMLFESFWRPIEQQIDQIDDTLNPRLTPMPLLPWLASWVDLELDPNWDEDKQRRLLSACVALYRRRGTYGGLKEFLEIYTGVTPNIIEHRASNMRLRTNAALGQGIAIGRDNVPHGLTIQMTLPALPEAEAALRRRIIETIIESEKPAHATYRLLIEEKAGIAKTQEAAKVS